MTTKEIASVIGGELVGDGDVRITGVNGIVEAREGDIAFVLNERFAPLAAQTKAACVVVPRSVSCDGGRTAIRVDNPSVAFSRIIEMLMPDRIPHPRGIHPSAVVAKSASIGSGAAMGAFVVVEEGASIGDGAVLYPFTYVGHRSKIGKKTVLYPNVTIREEVTIGDRVVIHAGSCIGTDGFGYDTLPDGSHLKMPQLGTVVVEDDVEIGSCVTVDRARLNKTVIGKGAKIDNLVQIAHNVKVGAHCLIAAQSGVAGSCELGRNVVLGGQVGMADHVVLGDFCVAGAQSGISKSYPPKTTLFGYPAKPKERAREIVAGVGLLPKLYARVHELEQKVREMEKKI